MTSRQSRRRARVLADGGSQLSVLLSRRATLCLEEVQRRTGETKAAIVERALWAVAAPDVEP